jgi:hypothetical protein
MNAGQNGEREKKEGDETVEQSQAFAVLQRSIK